MLFRKFFKDSTTSGFINDEVTSSEHTISFVDEISTFTYDLNTGTFVTKSKYEPASRYEAHKDKIISEYPFSYYVFKSYEQMIKDRFYRSGEQRKSILRPDYRFLMLRVRDVFKKQGRGG